MSKSAEFERHGNRSNDAFLQPIAEIHMQYILMNYVQEDGWTRLTKAEQEQGLAAYMAYSEALKKAGVLKGSNGLPPSSPATKRRAANGRPQVLVGPTG